MKSSASKPFLILAVITCVLVAWACSIYILRDREQQEQEEARRQAANAAMKQFQQMQQSLLNQTRHMGY